MSAVASTFAQDEIWMRAAELSGWRWSAAHAGFINETERRAPGHAGYILGSSPQDACFISGIETIQEAAAKIAEWEPSPITAKLLSRRSTLSSGHTFVTMQSSPTDDVYGWAETVDGALVSGSGGWWHTTDQLEAVRRAEVRTQLGLYPHTNKQAVPR